MEKKAYVREAGHAVGVLVLPHVPFKKKKRWTYNENMRRRAFQVVVWASGCVGNTHKIGGIH